MLKVENDTFIKKTGLMQKLLLVGIIVYILLLIGFFIPLELERLQNDKLINIIIILISYLGIAVFILIFLLLYFYSNSFSIEYEMGTQTLVNYNDLVVLKIKTELKDLSNYKEVGIEGVSGRNKLFLEPKEETHKKEYLTNVDTRNYKEGIWKEFLEEVRKEIG